jgi:Domain of Unknown Function (DUF748)
MSFAKETQANSLSERKIPPANNTVRLGHREDKRGGTHRGSLLVRRFWKYLCLSIVAAVLAVWVAIFVFGGDFINSYGKAKLERTFSQTYTRYALRIGHLDYSFGANRLGAQNVTLTGPTSQLKTAEISVSGIHWLQLLRKSSSLSKSLAHASLVATNFEAEFPQSRYRLRCARLKASVPNSELIAERAELGPSVSDEIFFAAHNFRTTRFQVVVPRCRVLGLAFSELLQGRSYRARSLQLFEPSFDALVNRDKALTPFINHPLMANEALAAVGQPLQIDSLVITNGYLTYRERMITNAAPGVLTFGAINLSVEGVANRSETSSTVTLRAQSKFMNAGVLTLLMTMPVASPDLSLHYSGSLSAMQLTPLDAFLETAEHLRIKSGSTQEVTFDVDVSSGQARGNVRATYANLEIRFLTSLRGAKKASKTV